MLTPAAPGASMTTPAATGPSMTNLRATGVPKSSVPPSVSNSSSRKPIKIGFDDIIDEVHYWGNAVVCFVLGANPPLHVMKGYVKRIWKDLSFEKIIMVAKDVFLVHFVEQQDREIACDMNGFMFDKKPFIIKPWVASMSYDKENLSTLSVWTRFPGLDVMYWGDRCLSKIAGMLGVVKRF